MRVRFRLPLSHDEAISVLLEAINAEVRYRERQFVNSPALMKQVGIVADWLRGETSAFGLLLCGVCGNGKTTFVKAIQQMINALQLPVHDHDRSLKYSMRIYDARDLAMMCRTDPKQFKEISELRMLAIDDLGTEAFEVKDYSNTMNPMLDLLLNRYDKGLFTIVTTNLRPEELRVKYGERLADRFNEMMEKIIFSNSSYRELPCSHLQLQLAVE